MFGNLQHGTEHLRISTISFWILLGFQPLSVPRPHVLAGLQILRASHDNSADTHLMSAKVLILTQHKVVEDGFSACGMFYDLISHFQIPTSILQTVLHLVAVRV